MCRKITGGYLMQSPTQCGEPVLGPPPLTQPGPQVLMEKGNCMMVLEGTGHRLELGGEVLGEVGVSRHGDLRPVSGVQSVMN